MGSKIRPFQPLPFACAAALAIAAAGCSMFGGRGGSEPATTAATALQREGAIDPRRYIGPNYCPELRILEGTQLVRQYEGGREDDPAAVIWQASVGKTARECLYDLQNNLTLRVGVSGRVIAGPKGGAGTVTVPLRLAVVKYKEAVLFSELYSIPVTIPAQGSTAFTDVREVVVPSPGTDTDYLLYVALGEKERDWLNPIAEEPAPVVAAVEEPVAALEEAAPSPPPPAAAPPQPATPRELPTPTGGFVLGR
jgi:hypothetical protein